MNLSKIEQRNEIQSKVDNYFRCNINIGPRAMSAMQGLWVEDGLPWECDSVVSATSVFEALLIVSPMALTSIYKTGAAVDRLFKIGEAQGTGHLPHNTLQEIFQGRYKDHLCYEMCPVYGQIVNSGNLTEVELFQAFMQTAYQGPCQFTEKVDWDIISMYSTDVGIRLIEAGFIDPEAVIESWSDEADSYRAESIAAQKLYEITKQASSISVIDPSHDLFQYALWPDSNGKIRIRPFGVGSLGKLAPTYLKEGHSYVFREGIFQPFTSITTCLNEDTILTFEDMINSSKCSEQEFQRFFSEHPNFLSGIDYKHVHPQVVLYNEDHTDYIPDFMLEPMASEFCDILEIKLPYAEMVRRLHSGSRVRFKAFVNEAVAQLVEYRRYFDSKTNRKAFHNRYGLQAYYPKMILVIGRRNHFKSDVERIELRSLLPNDLDIWTYDDLLNRAKSIKKISVI